MRGEAINRQRMILRTVLFLCSAISLFACKETILHDLDELNANQVQVVLSRAGIHSDKMREGNFWTLAVDSKLVSPALLIIEQSRILKRELRQSHAESSSLLQSPEEKRHSLERQTAWNLEKTLESLPHVLEARVHLYLNPENTFGLISQSKSESASVLLVVTQNSSIDQGNVRRLVSGASGILETAVAVIVARDQQQPIAREMSSINSSRTEVTNPIALLPGHYQPGKTKSLALLTASVGFGGLLFLCRRRRVCGRESELDAPILGNSSAIQEQNSITPKASLGNADSNFFFAEKEVF